MNKKSKEEEKRDKKQWGRLHCRIDPSLHNWLAEYAEERKVSMRFVIEQLLLRLRYPEE